MQLTKDMLIFLANFAASLVIAWVCLCRLNAMTGKNLLRVRAKYSLLLTGSLVAGTLPVWFQVQQSWATAIGLLFVMVLVMMEVKTWRYGPPHCTYKHCEWD